MLIPGGHHPKRHEFRDPFRKVGNPWTGPTNCAADETGDRFVLRRSTSELHVEPKGKEDRRGEHEIFVFSSDVKTDGLAGLHG